MGVNQSQERKRGKPNNENPKKFPHNYQALMSEAKPPVDATSNDLDQRLNKEGVFLGEKKKYWVDQDLRNCFILFAKGLSITWIEDPSYWKWESLEDIIIEPKIQVARLLDVCWLEVHGTFKSTDLSPEVFYEVAFEVKMKEGSYGWKAPVTLRLLGPDGKTQERQEKLQEKPKEEWIKLFVGEFMNPKENGGEIKFSLHETQSGGWKSGLVIKGAILQPKKQFG